MKAGCYLILDANGVRRMTKRDPSIGPREIAVFVRLNIPDSVFYKYIPTVDVTIPEAAILQAADVEIEVMELEVEGGREE